ncbi:MAG: hypothetical protein ACC660_04850, partial [Acidimicrobiales bacterium]
LMDTAGRILQAFTGADCRVAWLVTSDDTGTRDFLGPWGEQLLTFTDPDREVVKALGLNRLPAFVHIDQGLNISGLAEGWNPSEWHQVASDLADAMNWSHPLIPVPGDPTAYEGTPAF